MFDGQGKAQVDVTNLFGEGAQVNSMTQTTLEPELTGSVSPRRASVSSRDRSAREWVRLKLQLPNTERLQRGEDQVIGNKTV
jgi:hypothetical protein